MPKIKNITDKKVGVPNFPVFAPGEIREVNEEEAEYLKLCPSLEEVQEKAESLETSDDSKTKSQKKEK